MTTVALLLSSCATVVHDEKVCSPLPPFTDPNTGITTYFGAACDNFLTSDKEYLDEAAWQALQASWRAAGEAVECTTSQAIGDVKAEIEKLCSVTKCDYDTQAAITNGLEKIHSLGRIP